MQKIHGNKECYGGKTTTKLIKYVRITNASTSRNSGM